MPKAIQVSKHDIEQQAKQIKLGAYHQVFLTIGGDSKLTGHWFAGRSDFVLRPGLIVLVGLEGQTEESIAYAIAMVIRNQEGYVIV